MFLLMYYDDGHTGSAICIFLDSFFLNGGEGVHVILRIFNKVSFEQLSRG